MNAGKPAPRAELGEPAPHLGQRSTASMFDLRLSQLISLRCIPSGLHCKLEEASVLSQVKLFTCHARQRFWPAGCLGEGCAGTGPAGRCRLRASRSIPASPEPPANMAPLTPALPLPAGLPWRCPPAQPPPARRCVFTSGRRSRSPSAGGDGHASAGRPPSVHPRRAVLRETRHEGDAGGCPRGGGFGRAAAAPGGRGRGPGPGGNRWREVVTACNEVHNFQKLPTSWGMWCPFLGPSPEKNSPFSLH